MRIKYDRLQSRENLFSRLILAVCLLILAGTGPAGRVLAETRVALVIGNSAYKHAPVLANPRNDAEGMAAALKRLNFDVEGSQCRDKETKKWKLC
jgi:hypothetical protein